MNQEQNREKLADARRQIDETRERVLRSSEALEQGQTSKALTEGTRAERDLRTIEEELRQRTAGQFAEALRELRDEVRGLAEKEQKIGDQLQTESSHQKPARPTLREGPGEDREGLASEIEQLKQHLANALDKTKSIIEESETTEPLLSRKLYDTLRGMRSFNAEEALEQSARLTRYGMLPDARQFEQQAAKSIDALRAGVEAAAESILGSEAEALKLAQTELQQLTEAIRQELAANTPEGETTPGTRDGKRENSQQANAQPSRNQNSQNQDQQGTKPGEKDGEPSRQRQGQQGEGQQSGQQPGQSGQGQQAKQGQQGQGQQSGMAPGQRSQQEQQGGQSQQGQQSGQGQQPGGQQGQQAEGQPDGGSNPGSGSSEAMNDRLNPNQPTQQKSITQQLSQMFAPAGGDGSGMAGPHMPLTGGAFIEWSDRMRDVEEMLSSPELRAQVAMIRDRARLERLEVKRHSKQPNWELVRASIYGPLLELQQQVAEEIARRDPDKNMVPIDRDPVPDQYAEIVKQYYRELSRQQGDR
jgi:hypothetical protein